MAHTPFAILSLLLAIIGTASANCPSGTVQGLSTNDCYIVSEHGLAWYQAESRCTGKGGHLLSDTNQIVNTFLSNIPASLSSATYWIGGEFDGAIPNKWAWSDGSRWKWTNWAQGQPTKDGSQCLLLNATSGYWYSQSCSSPNAYICKVPPTGGYASTVPPFNYPPSLPTFPNPQKCDRDWFQIVASPLCYKVFSPNSSPTWTTASTNCQAISARLASIPNAVVNRGVQGLVEDGQSLWIGLHNPNPWGSSQWQWTDGSNATYTNWANSQPSTGDTYAYIDATGHWSSTGSSYQYNYICESVPNF
jgi:hypothetical protein